jgi:hypothetical protein
VLDKDGSFITDKGRGKVSADPQGSTFPWRPQTLQEELGETFLGKSGNVSKTEFTGKVFLCLFSVAIYYCTNNIYYLYTKFLGLYFSAHWCPPCRYVN